MAKHTSSHNLWISVALSALGLTASAQDSNGGDSPPSDVAGTISIGVEGYGRAPYPMLSRGARVGYGFDATRELELTYVESEKSVLLANFSYKEYGVQMKSWLSSFAHLGLGVGIRDVDLEYGIFLKNEESEREFHEEQRALTVTSNFGVEFHPWSFLGLGTDLVTVSVPVSWIKHTSAFPTAAQDYEEDPKTYPFVKTGFNVNYHLLRTYVEVRF